MQLKFSLHFFENSSNVMFHENPWQNADNQKEGRTDSRDEAVSFSNSNNAAIFPLSERETLFCMVLIYWFYNRGVVCLLLSTICMYINVTQCLGVAWYEDRLTDGQL